MSTAASIPYPLHAGRPGARVLVLGAGAGVAGALALGALASSFSPTLAAIGIVGLLVTCGMFLSPPFAVLVLCATLPFERIGRLTDDLDPIAVSASRIVGLLALASLALHMILRKEKFKFGLPFWLYAGYTAVAILSYAWADAPSDTRRDSFRVLGNLLFFFLIINAVRTYALARITVLIWLLASLAAATYSLSDYYIFTRGTVTEREMGLTSQRSATVLEDGAESRTLGTNVRRLFGTTAHPTLFGLNMLMTVPFLIWLQRTARGSLHLLWPAGLVAAGFVIVLSNTRAVMLLAGITLVMCFWRRLWRPNLQAATALATVLLVVVPFIPEDVYLRTLDPSLYTTTKADGLRVRLKYWEKSYEVIQDTWWHGIGVGNQTTIVNMITDEATGNLTPSGLRASAHNEYISVLMEVGLVGYLCFWGFVGLITAAAFRAAAIFRTLPDCRDEYLFSLACQVLSLGILLFAVQTEVFHYPLKAWWLTAGLTGTMLDLARTRLGKADAQSGTVAPA